MGVKIIKPVPPFSRETRDSYIAIMADPGTWLRSIASDIVSCRSTSVKPVETIQSPGTTEADAMVGGKITYCTLLPWGPKQKPAAPKAG